MRDYANVFSPVIAICFLPGHRHLLTVIGRHWFDWRSGDEQTPQLTSVVPAAGIS
jgi:hypothetical protein